MERQNNVDTIWIMQLRRVMECSVHKRSSTLIQTNLLQHFRPQYKHLSSLILIKLLTHSKTDSEDIHHIVFQKIC